MQSLQSGLGYSCFTGPLLLSIKICVRMAVQSLTTNRTIARRARIAILIDSSLTQSMVFRDAPSLLSAIVCLSHCLWHCPGRTWLSLSAKRRGTEIAGYVWRTALHTSYVFLFSCHLIPLVMAFHLFCGFLSLKHRFIHSFLFIKISFH